MKQIEAAKYEGYLWYCNEKKPMVFDGSEPVPEMNLDEEKNPFIIEGNLWDEDGRNSIMIRYVDGEYIVRRTKVKEEELKASSRASSQAYESGSPTLKKYLAHRIEGVKCLCFLQYWQAESDKMCEGMQVLRPSKLVLIGFDK